MPPKPRPLGERFWEKVNKTETCWIWTACKIPYGYGQIRINKKTYLAHRVSYELTNGPIPEGMYIDHICHTPSCVRPDHLRVVTQKQNMENLCGAKRTSKTGIRGVSWDKAKKKWTARVVHNRKTYVLGRYDDIQKAEADVLAKRLELFTHNDADRNSADAA